MGLCGDPMGVCASSAATEMESADVFAMFSGRSRDWNGSVSCEVLEEGPRAYSTNLAARPLRLKRAK